MSEHPEHPEYARTVHGSAEALGEEIATFADFCRQVDEETAEHHVPVVVGIMGDILHDDTNQRIQRALFLGEIDKINMVATINYYVAFAIGYRAGKQGLLFEPCFCHTSEEQRDHYAKIVTEVLVERGWEM